MQLIVNEGREAGASLEHSHAQLYALGFVPAAIARERERFGAYNERTWAATCSATSPPRRCAAASAWSRSTTRRSLICPWASRSPFELRVIPRTAARRASSEDERRAPRSMPHRAARARAALRRRAPSSTSGCARRRAAPTHFHWHVDIAPRLTIKAGFELATGVDINIYPPERARPRRDAAMRSPARCRRTRARSPASSPTPARRGSPTAAGPSGCARRSAKRACESHDLPKAVEAARGARLVPRAGLGRAGLRALPRPRPRDPEGPIELFGYVSYVRPSEGEPTRLPRRADFTDVTAEENPGWKIDLNDEVIGRWRGENGRAGARHPGLGPPAGPGRRRRHRRARARDRRPGRRSPTGASPWSRSTPSRATATRSSCRSSSGAAGRAELASESLYAEPPTPTTLGSCSASARLIFAHSGLIARSE